MGAPPQKTVATSDKSPAMPAAVGITFPTRPLQAGETDDADESLDMTMFVTVTVQGKAHDMTVRHNEVRKTKTEVRAANDRFVTKERLTVVSDIRTETKPFKPPGSPKRTAISGKAYLLDAQGTDIAVTDDIGGVVPADEAKLVKKVAHNFGKPDPMDTALNGQTFLLGQTVSIPPDKLNGMFADEGGKMNLSQASFTLTKNEGGVATLDVEMTVGVASGSLVISMPMKGTGRVDVATGHALDFTMTGTMTVTGTDPKMPMNGSGTIAMRLVHTYGK